jgi:hypothetical protein
LEALYSHRRLLAQGAHIVAWRYWMSVVDESSSKAEKLCLDELKSAYCLVCAWLFVFVHFALFRTATTEGQKFERSQHGRHNHFLKMFSLSKYMRWATSSYLPFSNVAMTVMTKDTSVSTCVGDRAGIRIFTTRPHGAPLEPSGVDRILQRDRGYHDLHKTF